MMKAQKPAFMPTRGKSKCRSLYLCPLEESPNAEACNHAHTKKVQMLKSIFMPIQSPNVEA